MSDANLQSDWLTNGSTGVFLDFMKTQDITQFII